MAQGPPRDTFRLEAGEEPADSGSPGAAADAPAFDTLPTETPARYLSGAPPEVLGVGGIGRVLAVEDTALGREVALKELLPARAAQGSASNAPTGASEFTTGRSRPAHAHTSRFLREAQITARLEHPGIVPVYELGRRADGTLYYTMRRIRGRTLGEALSSCKSLDARLALLRHVVDACYALAYAHSRGVVHRDLKPENIMVGPFGETVVLDWGLAAQKGDRDERRRHFTREIERMEAATSRQTLAGTVMGTPAYMSPEQALGHIDQVDERSDIWSLGAVLYEVLTGSPPFEGDSPHTVLHRVRTEDAPPVRFRCPDAPPELAAVADKALSRERAARYSSAADIAGEIEAWRSGRRVGAYAYTSVELLRRFYGQNRVALTIGGVAIAGMLGVALLNHQQVRAERDRAMVAEGEARTRAEQARRWLADSLEEDAGQAWQAGDSLRGELLAAGALSLREDPSSRGILMASATAPRPSVTAILPDSEGCAALAWSPDGRTVACGDARGLRVWDLGAPATPHAVEGPGVLRIVYGPDGGRLYGVTSTDEVVAWEAGDLHVAWRAPTPGTRLAALAVTPDGTTVAAGGRANTAGSPYVFLFDAVDGGAEREWAGESHAYSEGLQFSADGQTLWSAGWGVEARVTGSGERLSRAHPGDAALALATADGRLAVAWQDQRVSTTSPSGAEADLPIPGVFTRAVAWSTDGSLLATASSDGAVRLWDGDTAAELARLVGYAGRSVSLAFSPGGTRLAAGSERSPVRVWELAGLRERPNALPPVSFWLSTDARHLVWLEEGAAVFADPATGSPLRTIPLPPLGSPFLTWTTTGGSVWGTTVEGAVVLLRPERDGHLLLPVWPSTPVSVAGGPSGFAVLHDDGTVRAFDGAGSFRWARLVSPPEGGVPTSIAWSADGASLHVSVPPETMLRLDGASGAITDTLAVPPYLKVHTSWSGDGALVALPTPDHHVRILDTARFQAVAELGGHTASTWGAVFSPDNRLLLTIGGDETARLWALDPPHELALLGRLGAFVWQGGFGSDGRTIYTAGNERTLRRWDLEMLGRPGATLLGELERQYGLELDGAKIQARAR